MSEAQHKDPAVKAHEENPPRFDAQGRLLCKARTTQGAPCMGPAVSGLRVCRMHGASTARARNAAKVRLAELVNPAIGTLAKEMVNAEKSADRQRAANSILDRAGVGRVQKTEILEAREMLAQKLLERRQEREIAAANEVEYDPDNQNADGVSDPLVRVDDLEGLTDNNAEG